MTLNPVGVNRIFRIVNIMQNKKIGLFIPNEMFSEIQARFSRKKPVSYTHLDVYKRQLYIGLCLTIQF